MAARGRRLVAAFGFGLRYVGWATTADVVNYEIKRRTGEWESAFVGAAGRLTHAIVSADHQEAVALRDFLNDAPYADVHRLVAEREVPRETVEVMQLLLEAAWSRHREAGVIPDELRALAWVIVDAPPAQLERVRRDLAPLVNPVSAEPEWPAFDDFPFAAVVFDLDQTLVDSSGLGTPAARRAWAQRPSVDGEVRPLEVLGRIAAHDLPARLAERDVPVGIATRSPEHYAARVLEQFAIHADVVRAGTGNKAASFRACAAELGVSPGDLCVIGDDASDISAAREIGAWSLGALWAPERWPDRLQPDIACREPERLLSVPDWRKLRLLAEVETSLEPVVHAGSWITNRDRGTLALGRYFPTDSRRHGEGLSQAILSGKGRADPHPAIERALRTLGNHIRSRAMIDLVVSVPPANGHVDRFERYRVIAAESLAAEPASALRVARDVSGYKWMSHAKRHLASEGRFKAEDSVAGLHVLVIDDVSTSGATFAACTNALQDAGAAEISCVAFATTQD